MQQPQGKVVRAVSSGQWQGLVQWGVLVVRVVGEVLPHEEKGKLCRAKGGFPGSRKKMKEREAKAEGRPEANGDGPKHLERRTCTKLPENVIEEENKLTSDSSMSSSSGRPSRYFMRHQRRC